MEYMDAISLIVLCATLIAAFVFKLNSGVVSIAVALILARIVGISDKQLFSYFNSSLFMMLFGVMLLFSIAQQNKTLELLAKKALRSAVVIYGSCPWWSLLFLRYSPPLAPV